jgi:hypothetical protein
MFTVMFKTRRTSFCARAGCADASPHERGVYCCARERRAALGNNGSFQFFCLRSNITRWQSETSGAILVSHIHALQYHILSAFQAQLGAFDTYSPRIPTSTACTRVRKAEFGAHSTKTAPKKVCGAFQPDSGVNLAVERQ